MSAGKVAFVVEGIPGPQGSKHARPIYTGRGAARQFTGRVATVESSKKVKPWRAAVKAAAELATVVPIGGPVELSVTFFLPRPAGHLGTGRNAGTVRASAPTYPAAKPDLDKLLRSTCDAITESGAWSDDAAVVNVMAAKRYAAPGMKPGAMVTIRPVRE